MEWRLTQENLTHLATDAIFLFHTEDQASTHGLVRQIDEMIDFQISHLISVGEVKGEYGELTILHLWGQIPAARLFILGLGKEEKLNLQRFKQVVGKGIQRAEELELRQIAMSSPSFLIKRFHTVDCVQAMVEGAELAAYEPPSFKEEQKQQFVKTIFISAHDYSLSAFDEGLLRGKVFAQSTNLARFLTDQPANWMTPDAFASKAEEIAQKRGLEFMVLEQSDLDRLGMHAILTVGKGSLYSPRLLVLRYTGDHGRKDSLALIGKGITFDSGGLQLKGDKEMFGMKRDMAGAATVLAVMDGLAQLTPYHNVMALLPICENIVDAGSMRPEDVIRTYSGKTVEITHTDSEGRLILADAISYAKKLGASRLVDIATLTGATIIALGFEATALMTNDAQWGLEVKRAARMVGEKTWELPLFEEYEEYIESDIADMKNDDGMEAGAIQAGVFLKQFAEETPWVHLDIAGTAELTKERGIMSKGATGVGVRTLLQLALREVEE
ncbi:leucyl aminopeptidase [Risungbinella massiliensis]|uniref:leucyl aminopeptidase n=1 Tax=Risungbinella massiliensis TaxID=1329796 RepID=UPI0005CBFEA0|nr:leucyl aminopeptidase [Risungbinella massiliensis]